VKVSRTVLKGGSGGNVVSPTWRYMDPVTGRFVSEDPAGSGANWFAYCGSNPVVATDPSGKFLDILLSLLQDAREDGVEASTSKAVEQWGPIRYIQRSRSTWDR
jgi:hypothetical protein